MKIDFRWSCFYDKLGYLKICLDGWKITLGGIKIDIYKFLVEYYLPTSIFLYQNLDEKIYIHCTYPLRYLISTYFLYRFFVVFYSIGPCITTYK